MTPDLRVGRCVVCSAECWARDDTPLCYQCVREQEERNDGN